MRPPNAASPYKLTSATDHIAAFYRVVAAILQSRVVLCIVLPRDWTEPRNIMLDRNAGRLKSMYSTRNERAGTAALEFAIVTPALLMMFVGMIAFGILFMNLHEVQELASSAARASVPGLSATERNSLAQGFVTQALASSIMLNPADVTVTTATSGTPATMYSVTVNYNLKDTVIPKLAQIISQKFNNVSRTSTVVFGGY